MQFITLHLLIYLSIIPIVMVTNKAFITRSSLIGCALRTALNRSLPEIESVIIFKFLNHQRKLQAVIEEKCMSSRCDLDDQNIETVRGIKIPRVLPQPEKSRQSSVKVIVHVSFRNNYIRHLRGLRSYYGPTTMDLTGNQLREFRNLETDHYIHGLYPLHPLYELSHLILDDNHITSTMLQNTFDFISLPSLKTLSLRNNCITTLHDVHFPDLQELDLSFNPISDLTNFTVNVHDLVLCHCGLTDDILRTFPISEIHILRLMDNKLCDLSSISFPTDLQILYLESNPIGQCLYIPPHFQELHELHLNDVGITEIELKSILYPGCFRKLWLLDFSRNMIGSIDGIHFPPNLELLLLGRNKIRNLKATAFPERLTHLSLESNLLRNNRRNRMKVKFLSRLIHLDLQKNAIHCLRGVTLPDGLRIFHLDNNGITDLMLFKMQFSLPPQLTTLSLQHNRLSSKLALKIIVQMQQWHLMLDLEGNNISSGCPFKLCSKRRSSLYMRRSSLNQLVNGQLDS